MKIKVIHVKDSVVGETDRFYSCYVADVIKFYKNNE